MLEKFDSQILIRGVLLRQFERNIEHRQTVEAHPRRTIRLVDIPARREPRAAVEQADVIQPQEAALKNIAAFGVFAIDPPGKIEQHLMKNALQENRVMLAGAV